MKTYRFKPFGIITKNAITKIETGKTLLLKQLPKKTIQIVTCSN